MNPALFVAGTDTGAGKTRVGLALIRALRARGLSVGVFGGLPHANRDLHPRHVAFLAPGTLWLANHTEQTMPKSLAFSLGISPARTESSTPFAMAA